jgi:glutamate synthase (NADPH/NADH) small chain
MQQGNEPFAGLETDIHPPLDAHESSVEADRCYFCHDAPCVTACPTGIDIPMFIRQIQTGNPAGSGKTIFDENILGGMCARVCPTETLCEQACVREAAEKKPVRIGALQRYATDHVMQGGGHPYQRAAATGKRVCVVGAGPAGLSCAHRLARYGHDVTIVDAGDKPGGLNEYGIASYKTVDNFAQHEVEFVLGIGGITLQSGVRIGDGLSLQQAVDDYDAVFLGVGLDGVNQSQIPGGDLQGVGDAVEFIAALRQADDFKAMHVGRRVLVIGGGMTAIDAAVQARMLGAEDVTIAYRRTQDKMNASVYEQQLAQTHGVKIRHSVQPLRFIGDDGAVTAAELEYTTDKDGKLSGTGETFVDNADQVLMAIGQSFDAEYVSAFGLSLRNNRLQVSDERKTSHEKIWAGGDCVDLGDDLTVWAVQDGKLAAESIHRTLNGSAGNDSREQR